MRRFRIAAFIGVTLAACSVRTTLPPTVAVSRNAVQRRALPVERRTVVKLSSRYALNVDTKPVRNGTFAGISETALTAYAGAAIIVDGPKAPAVPKPPGAKKMLFAVTITVTKAVTATGTWNIVFQGNPGCVGLLTTGFYSSGGSWQTYPFVCAGTEYIFPTWTALRPHAKYVAATFLT